VLVNQSFYLYKISGVEFGAGHSPTQYKITNKKLLIKLNRYLWLMYCCQQFCGSSWRSHPRMRSAMSF